MSEEYRAIKEDLLTEALGCVSGRVNSWRLRDGIQARTTDVVDISVAFITALAENIAEGDDGCDHSVNICFCGPRAVLADLQLWLEGKERCSACGGDKYVFSQVKYDEARAAYASRYRVGDFEDYFGDGDDAGMEECGECDGEGVVEL